jgi:HSP20 family protein
MASTRWDPLEGLGILRKEMDRVIEDFFRGAPFQTPDRGTFEPAADVWETPESVVVRVMAPGVSKEQLHLTITEDTLTIKGEVPAKAAPQEHTVHQREIRSGAFQRVIPLPVAVRREAATAQLKDGILEVSLPKSEVRQARDIPITGDD